MADSKAQTTAWPELPPEADWDRWGNLGNETVRKAITKAALRVTTRDNSTFASLAVALGALTASGDLIAALTRHGNQRVTETMAVAYLRGALRGKPGPVNEDGSDYKGAPLDA